MFRWPRSINHIETTLAGHFLMKTNEKILQLSLPALEPVAKRARMDHVNESLESQVISNSVSIYLCILVSVFILGFLYSGSVFKLFLSFIILQVLSQWIVDQPPLGRVVPCLPWLTSNSCPDVFQACIALIYTLSPSLSHSGTYNLI